MKQKFLQTWRYLTSLGAEGQTPSLAKRIVMTNQVNVFLSAVALVFMVPWAFEGNLKMVLINFGLAVLHALFPFLNSKRMYDLSRFLIVFILSTVMFVFVGMVGRNGDAHMCFFPIAGCSVLLFEAKERLKLMLAVSYPILLFFVLLSFDFKLFPNYVGVPLSGLNNFTYAVNFMMVVFSMLLMYRTAERSEGEYRILYEELIKSQKLLDEERAKAIYSMRMAALGEMAGGIAHEINSPLNVITGLSEQMQRRLPGKKMSDEMVFEAVKKINNTANRIGEIVSSLRNFSRTADGLPIREANIEIILHETLALCKERFRSKNINLGISIPDKVPQVTCRTVEISQVLLNLLNNACDAIEKEVEPKINIVISHMNGRVLISIEDNGHGIDSNHREKIFSPFFTTKEVGKGTGLGLSISKGLVEANRGKLYLDTNSDFTRFVMELKAV